MAEEVQTKPESNRGESAGPADRPAARPQRPAGSPFRVVKPGQGIYVRWLSAIGAGVLAVSMAHFVWSRLPLFGFVDQSDPVRTLVPVIVLLVAVYLIFWAVGRNQSVVDFMIHTEGEMKKVNWSTRKEVWGATRVVIVTVLALAILLFIVDMFFIFFFGAIGVVKFDLTSQLVGGGG